MCDTKRLLNPKHLVVLLAGSIFHTSIQYKDFVNIFHVSLDLSTIYFANFNGVEPFLCILVILSQNATTCFLE